MQFVKQRVQLPIANVAGDNLKTANAKKSKHSSLFNDHLKMIIAGRSGVGKNL